MLDADTYARIQITAYFEPLKSWPKKTRLNALTGVLRPAGKPDIDNVAKAVLDALNGVAYEDDKQVVILHCEKKYAETAQLQVTVTEVKE